MTYITELNLQVIAPKYTSTTPVLQYLKLLGHSVTLHPIANDIGPLLFGLGILLHKQSLLLQYFAILRDRILPYKEYLDRL